MSRRRSPTARETYGLFYKLLADLRKKIETVQRTWRVNRECVATYIFLL